MLQIEAEKEGHSRSSDIRLQVVQTSIQTPDDEIAPTSPVQVCTVLVLPSSFTGFLYSLISRSLLFLK